MKSMKLEQQVVSLELAKKLKELGVPQESHFYWSETVSGSGHPSDAFTYQGNHKLVDHHNLRNRGQEIASAFTVAELGEMLPKWFVSEKLKDGWMAKDDMAEPGWNCTSLTEADARAKLLVHLLEHKIITPESLT